MCACVSIPADVVVVGREQCALQLCAQAQAVCVLGSVGVVEEQNHQQEEHVEQEVLERGPRHILLNYKHSQ